MRNPSYGLCCCLLATGLLGCDGVDRAAVFVTPAPVPQSAFPAAEHAPRIRATFDAFTRRHGYDCHRSTRKRGYVCRGPADLHMTFEERINGAGYVIGFSWVRGDDRTTRDFERLVLEFAESMRQSGARVETMRGQFAE